MYCRKCYTSLANVTHLGMCPKCDRRFDPQDPRTTLPLPFPPRKRLIVRVIATTLLGILAALVVAWFQLSTAMAPIPSGH